MPEFGVVSLLSRIGVFTTQDGKGSTPSGVFRTPSNINYFHRKTSCMFKVDGQVPGQSTDYIQSLK